MRNEYALSERVLAPVVGGRGGDGMKNERGLDGPGIVAGERTTRVDVELDWDAPEAGVLVQVVRTTERCADAELFLDAWQRAAQYGARFAIQVVNTLPCLVNVVEVAASPRDSNATIVAAATARAVWSALRHVPDAELEAHIEGAVRRSLSAPPEELCPFRLR